MIIPSFWAESRVQRKVNGRQITVRRFGWSESSQAEADEHAISRTEEAFARIASGQNLPRREPRVAYHGAEGVPIREEVLSRHGQTVITRNSYGAHCLNTPNVFFADVDFENADEPGCGGLAVGIIAGLAAAVFVGQRFHSVLLSILSFFVATIAIPLLILFLRQFIVSVRGGAERIAMNRLETFIRHHPDWNLRVYRTANGLRILALHQFFDPRSAEVDRAFTELGVDRMYRLMCRKQNCFRARLTPKPWRIGIAQHMKPRPGVWPVDPGRLADRQKWIDQYEQSGIQYSVCRLIRTSPVMSPAASEIEAVRRLHDELCRADSELPLA